MTTRTPFPGMDPYLEHPVLWPGVHFSLIAAIRQQLSPKLRPRYSVSAEERVYLEAPSGQRIPDIWIQEPRAAIRRPRNGAGRTAVIEDVDAAEPIVFEAEPLEIREPYLEILDVYRSQQVVTVIEVVSPTNKRPGPGRDAYVRKQQATLSSEVHLVEIDLLRTGQHVLAVPGSGGSRPANGYLVSVSRHPQRTRFELYPWLLKDRMPMFRIPLAEPDPDVVLDLPGAFEQTYEDGSYMIRVKYDEPCEPPLTEEDQAWATERWHAYRDAHPEWFPPGGAT